MKKLRTMLDIFTTKKIQKIPVNEKESANRYEIFQGISHTKVITDISQNKL